MNRSRQSEEKVIGILKQHRAGLGATELRRTHAISNATIYKWRSKYGDVDVSNARKLKALEEENRKLTKLLAKTALDAAILKEMLAERGAWQIKDKGYTQRRHEPGAQGAGDVRNVRHSNRLARSRERLARRSHHQHAPRPGELQLRHTGRESLLRQTA